MRRDICSTDRSRIEDNKTRGPTMFVPVHNDIRNKTSYVGLVVITEKSPFFVHFA